VAVALGQIHRGLKPPLKLTRGKAVPKPLISTYVHKYEVSYAGVVDAAATIYGDTERESGTLGQSTPFGHLARSVETKATVPPCAARGAPLRPKIGLPYQLYVSAPRAKMFELVGLCNCALPPSRHRWQPHGTFSTFIKAIVIKGVNFPLFGFRKMLLPNPNDSSRNPMTRAAPLIVRQWPRAAWQTTRT